MMGDDDLDDDESPICPYCGAYSARSCDLEDPDFCPWEDLDDD